MDDLGVVVALQVDRRDAEFAVAELALNDDQRDALVSHLDRMCMAQLMRREAAPHAGRGGQPAQVGLATLDRELHGRAQRVLRERYGPARVLRASVEVHAASSA